jgi:hypothetical protein
MRLSEGMEMETSAQGLVFGSLPIWDDNLFLFIFGIKD